MLEIKSFLCLLSGWLLAIFQGIWLLTLYFCVAYVMVGSLGSLQLRDALVAEKSGATFDLVIRTKNHFETKAENQFELHSRNSESKYNDINDSLDKIYEKLDDLWEKIIKSAIQLGTIEQTQVDSLDNLDEINKKIEITCFVPTPENALLCENHSQFKVLLTQEETLYEKAENIFESEGDVMEIQDAVMRLREKTPFTDLFTTVDFMENLGYDMFLKQPRELLVLQLTMVMGLLGSLVAMTWSFIRHDAEMSFRRTLFLPLVGAVSAFIIFVFFKAGQLTITSGSGTSSLSPFFLSFVGIISGLLSERAYARMEAVGRKFFTDDSIQLRWGVGLKSALHSSDISLADLASFLDAEEGVVDGIVNETMPATLKQQQLIAACLRRNKRELFTDEAPNNIEASVKDELKE
ncbi:MAG: hypothetical protein V7782_11405 [Psychromonas sp.]